MVESSDTSSRSEADRSGKAVDDSGVSGGGGGGSVNPGVSGFTLRFRAINNKLFPSRDSPLGMNPGIPFQPWFSSLVSVQHAASLKIP